MQKKLITTLILAGMLIYTVLMATALADEIIIRLSTPYTIRVEGPDKIVVESHRINSIQAPVASTTTLSVPATTYSVGIHESIDVGHQ